MGIWYKKKQNDKTFLLLIEESNGKNYYLTSDKFPSMRYLREEEIPKNLNSWVEISNNEAMEIRGFKKMKLGEFIKKMCQGWGFNRSGTVERIGNALKELIPSNDLENEVRVLFVQDHYGSGPGFVYTYDWVVSDYDISGNGGRLPATEKDKIFGYQKNNLPALKPLKNGFMVGYEW